MSLSASLLENRKAEVGYLEPAFAFTAIGVVIKPNDVLRFNVTVATKELI